MNIISGKIIIYQVVVFVGLSIKQDFTMKVNRIKVPEDRTRMSFNINLTQDFMCVCQLMNIPFEEALQTYVDHIKVYNHFVNEHRGTNYEATAIFERYAESHREKFGLQTAKYKNVHINPIKQIVKLGQAEIGSESHEYTKIIEDWYGAVIIDKNAN